MSDLEHFVPLGSHAALLRSSAGIRRPIAAFGMRQTELLYSDLDGALVRVEPGSNASNRKVVLAAGSVMFAPSGAGMTNGLEVTARDPAKLPALAALALMLLRGGYLVDYQQNRRWVTGDPVFSLVPPQELLDIATEVSTLVGGRCKARGSRTTRRCSPCSMPAPPVERG